jgi:hypothetical protein
LREHVERCPLRSEGPLDDYVQELIDSVPQPQVQAV